MTLMTRGARIRCTTMELATRGMGDGAVAAPSRTRAKVTTIGTISTRAFPFLH
jgi:hypothetical protein